MRKSSSQWSFANNSAVAGSQFLSFKAAQEQGGTHKSYVPGFSQRSLSLDKLGGSQHPVHPHPWQSKDVHISSQTTNQLGPSTITSSIFSSHLTPNAPSIVTSTIRAPPISSVPPSNGPVVGSTDLKNAPSISVGPCQLTLFYNGSVCVYDNVSPEKAQAIMLLAGNGDSKNNSTSSTPLPKVQSPMSRPPLKDNATFNHSPGFSSPIALSPVHTPVNSVSLVQSSCGIEVNPIKPVVSLTTTRVNCPELPKSTAPVGAAGVKSAPSGSAVPQARKASLARFLEKRKDRVTATAPYVVNKNSSEYSTTRTTGSTFMVNSASSSPLPAST